MVRYRLPRLLAIVVNTEPAHINPCLPAVKRYTVSARRRFHAIALVNQNVHELFGRVWDLTCDFIF